MQSNGRRWFLGVAALGAGAYGLSSLFGSDEAAEEAVNRIWLERVPRSQRDVVGHFVMIRRGGRRIGISGTSSRWRHQVELFKWALERERLSLVYPQTETTRRLTAKVLREGPRPFDRTLILTDENGDEARYYSRKGLIIRPGEALEVDDDEPALSELGAAIAARLPLIEGD